MATQTEDHFAPGDSAATVEEVKPYRIHVSPLRGPLKYLNRYLVADALIGLLSVSQSHQAKA
jgi:hypothetical protein